MTSQVKLFGSFARWSQDVAPPLDGGPPGRSLLTTAAAAIRYAVTSPAGPVHLNMQVWYGGGIKECRVEGTGLNGVQALLLHALHHVTHIGLLGPSSVRS